MAVKNLGNSHHTFDIGALAFSRIMNPTWESNLTHELRTPRESFFSKISTFGAWADNLGWTFLRHLGYFLAWLSAPILVLWIPCPSFPIFNHYFYKKLCLYIQLPNIHLGERFEFGPQRILRFSLRLSVVSASTHCETIWKCW